MSNVVILSVIMSRDIMLSVIMSIVVMLSVIVSSVVMLSVIMSSVVMLSVSHYVKFSYVKCKHRTFPPVFRFTPIFWIFCKKISVVKRTLGHRKFSAVRNKNGVNLKKRRKNCKFMVLQSLRDKTIIFPKFKNCGKFSITTLDIMTLNLSVIMSSVVMPSVCH
jgi:hypothetical protein